MILNDETYIYSEEDRERLRGQVYDLGTEVEFATYRLGTFTENLFSPYFLRVEFERILIPDIAKIVLSFVTKAKDLVAV